MLKSPARFSEVFILGVGRSGTTLLRTILNGHSKLYVTPEAHFVLPLLKYKKHYDVATGFDKTRFSQDLMQAGSFTHWHMGSKDINKAVSGAANTTDAIARLYCYYAALQGKQIAIDKTPSLTQHIGFILKNYPNARFVHLIRDGRDVAVSQYSAGWTKSVDEAAVDWSVRTKLAQKDGVKLGKKHYLEIRYEDLVTKPKIQVKALCSWLGVAYEPKMLKDTSSNAKQLLGSVYQPNLHNNLLQPIKPQKPKGTAEQRRRVEHISAKQLQLLGYTTVDASNAQSMFTYSYLLTRKFGVAALRQLSWRWRLPRNY